MDNLLIQRFTLQRSTMSFILKNYSLVKVTYLPIRLKKAIFWKWLVSVSKWYPLFYQPHPFYRKILKPSFWENLKNLNPPCTSFIRMPGFNFDKSISLHALSKYSNTWKYNSYYLTLKLILLRYLKPSNWKMIFL